MWDVEFFEFGQTLETVAIPALRGVEIRCHVFVGTEQTRRDVGRYLSENLEQYEESFGRNRVRIIKARPLFMVSPGNDFQLYLETARHEKDSPTTTFSAIMVIWSALRTPSSIAQRAVVKPDTPPPTIATRVLVAL